MTDYEYLQALCVPHIKTADTLEVPKKEKKITWNGLSLVIEYLKGQTRSGKSKDGKEWSTEMKDHYGSFPGKPGADGDDIDFFLNEANPESELVFIVNQRKKDGSFDEGKVILGCTCEKDAVQTYLRNYSPGWKGLGSIVPLTLPSFKEWLAQGDPSKPLKQSHMLIKQGSDLTEAGGSYWQQLSNGKTIKRADLLPGGAGDDKLDSRALESPETVKVAETEEEFWKRNEASKERNKYNKMGHLRDGYIPCPDCQYRYHAMPEDEKCPKCGGTLGVYLRSMKRPIKQANLKTTFENSKLIFVKRATDDGHQFTICVDLDGTLAEKEEPFNPKTIGEPRERTVKWVRDFHEHGARIIVFTVRGDTKQVKTWLEKHDIPFDYVNENPDQPKGTSGKVYADVYWDDKAFNAEDPDEHGPELLRRVKAHGDDSSDEEEPKPFMTVMRQTVITITAPSLLHMMRGEQDPEEEEEDADAE